jgi:hypothetical protein
MITSKKYITIGDEVINNKDRYIGIVTRKECISYREGEDVSYTVELNDSKTYIAFGNRIGGYKTHVKCFTQNIEPLNTISMYSKRVKKYISPIFNHIKYDNIRCYDEVKMVDNYYVERLDEKFRLERSTIRISSHPTVSTDTGVNIVLDLFNMKFHVQKIDKENDEIICVSQTNCGKKFKAINPIECVELIKKNNFFKRLLLKYKYNKV